MKKLFGFRLRATLIAVGVAAVTAGLASGLSAAKRVSIARAAETSAIRGHVYVHQVENGDWELTSRHRGIYSVNTETGAMENIYENNSMTTGNAGVYIKGKYYVSRSSTAGTYMINGVSVSVYDINTQQETTTNLKATWLNRALAYAYDGLNDEAYAITNGGTSSVQVLAKFDYDNLTYTPFVQLKNSYTALATDGEGNFYGILQNTSDLVKIDVTTGVSERLTSADFLPATGLPQALTWSPADGKLLWVATGTDEETIVVAFNPDPDNTRCERVCSLGKASILGIYTTDPYAKSDAPMAVSDLRVEYTQPGALSGNVMFTVPETTVGGESLPTGVSAVITVDGNTEESRTLETAPGVAISENFGFTEGLHKVSVRIANGESKSEPVTIYTFAGFDTPKAVENLSYTIAEGGLVTLTWDVPEGVNGGTLGTLEYKVSRNGEYLTTVTEPTFSEVIGGQLSVYRYTVEPVAEGLTGEATTTDKIVMGDALELPYLQTFANEDDFTLFTVVDANNDGVTWTYNTYYHMVSYQKTGTAAEGNDYLLCPKVKLENGHVYSFRFTTYNNGSKPELLSVFLAGGASAEDIAKARTIMEATEFTNRTQEEKELLLTPERSGEYLFGFHYCTPANNSLNMNIKSIVIEDLGSANAPAAVDDLNVIPGADGNLSASVSFTAPVKDFNGGTLSQITTIELSRNGELINTFDSPAPAARLSFEDTTVPAPGFYTYTVSSANESGFGRVASTTQYVGALSLPVELPLNTAESAAIMTADDTDGDGLTWHYDADKNGLVYMPTKAGFAKDKVSTPLISLKKGQVLKISLDQQPADETVTLPGDCPGFYIGIGKGNEAANIIYPYAIVRPGETSTEERTYIVPEDGIYYLCIGIETYVSNTNSGVLIRNIKIEDGPDPLAPTAATGFTVTPAAEGRLSATFSFTMPETTIDDSVLEGEVSAYVYNQAEELIASVENRQPGESVSVDAAALQGLRRYKVYTANSKGTGAWTAATTFCGVDVPLGVTELLSFPSAGNMSTELSWEAPTEGSNGGWFDASQLRYKVSLYDAATGSYELIAVTDKLNYEFTTDDEVQKEYTFSVIPVTDAGDGTQPYNCVSFLGAPLQLPFSETFADGQLHTSPWRTVGQFETVDWRLAAECPELGISASDGGFAVLSDKYARLGTAELYMPKMSLAESRQPVLKFKAYHYNDAHAMFEVELSTDETNFSNIGTVNMGDHIVLPDNPTALGWEDVEIDLSDYVNYPWVMIRFSGIVASGSEAAVIDDISVEDVYMSGISNVGRNDMAIYTVPGGIMVNGSQTVDIYTADGTKVCRFDAARTNICRLSPGLYIVKSTGKTIKVVVK